MKKLTPKTLTMEKQIYLDILFGRNQQKQLNSIIFYDILLQQKKQSLLDNLFSSFQSHNNIQDQYLFLQNIQRKIKCFGCCKHQQNKIDDQKQTYLQSYFSCCSFNCNQVSPWICGNQQCICYKKHQNCKIIKSQKILLQIYNKLKKPLKKQVQRYLKAKFYLLQYIKNIISQEKQIIYSIYQLIHENQHIFQKNNLNQQNQNQNKEEKKKYKIYLYGLNKNLQKIQCLEKKILSSQDQQLHEKCKCIPIQLNFLKQIQKPQDRINILNSLKNIISDYNKLFDIFDNLNELLQNQILMSNLNSFERIIFSQLNNIKISNQITGFFTHIKPLKLTGHLIYKSLQYKQSQFNNKIKQFTDILKLKKKWKQTCQKQFCNYVQGQLIKTAEFSFFWQHQQFATSIEKVSKALKLIFQRFTIGQEIIIPNHLKIIQKPQIPIAFYPIRIINKFMIKFPFNKKFQVRTLLNQIQYGQEIQYLSQKLILVSSNSNFQIYTGYKIIFQMIKQKEVYGFHMKINIQIKQSIMIEIIKSLSLVKNIKKIQIISIKQFSQKILKQIINSLTQDQLRQLTLYSGQALSQNQDLIKKIWMKFPNLKSFHYQPWSKAKYFQQFCEDNVFYKIVDFKKWNSSQRNLFLSKFPSKLQNITIEAPYDIISAQIIKNMSQLKQIAIQASDFNNKISPQLFQQIQKIQNKLKSFILNNVRIQTIKQIEIISKIIYNNPLLQSFGIDMLFDRYNYFNDEFIVLNSPNLKNLKELFLIKCLNISGKGFEQFTQLKMLIINQCKSIEVEYVCKALSKINFLVYLSLENNKQWVNDHVLKTISQFCCELQYLSLRSCINVSKQGVLNIKKLLKLNCLILVGMKIQLTDQQFIQIAKHLKRLKKLSINASIPFIKYQLNSKIQISQNLSQLKHLNVFNCPRDTKQFLSSLKSIKTISVG